MSDVPFASLETSGTVSSRFVSESDLESAKARKQEEWKAAYARLGQEPPKEEEQEYDPRSLFEKLHSVKETKKSEWDDKMKLSNQFRGLEPDELQFLSGVEQERREKERERERIERGELEGFRALQARQQSAHLPPPSTLPSVPSNATASSSKPPAPKAPVKKDSLKSLMKGIKVVKKPKAKPAAGAAAVAPAGGVGKGEVEEGKQEGGRSALTGKTIGTKEVVGEKRKLPGGGLAGLVGVGSGSDSDSEGEGGGGKKAKLD